MRDQEETKRRKKMKEKVRETFRAQNNFRRLKNKAITTTKKRYFSIIFLPQETEKKFVIQCFYNSQFTIKL